MSYVAHEVVMLATVAPQPPPPVQQQNNRVEQITCHGTLPAMPRVIRTLVVGVACAIFILSFLLTLGSLRSYLEYCFVVCMVRIFNNSSIG